MSIRRRIAGAFLGAIIGAHFSLQSHNAAWPIWLVVSIFTGWVMVDPVGLWRSFPSAFKRAREDTRRMYPSVSRAAKTSGEFVSEAAKSGWKPLLKFLTSLAAICGTGVLWIVFVIALLGVASTHNLAQTVQAMGEVGGFLLRPFAAFLTAASFIGAYGYLMGACEKVSSEYVPEALSFEGAIWYAVHFNPVSVIGFYLPRLLVKCSVCLAYACVGALKFIFSVLVVIAALMLAAPRAAFWLYRFTHSDLRTVACADAAIGFLAGAFLFHQPLLGGCVGAGLALFDHYLLAPRLIKAPVTNNR